MTEDFFEKFPSLKGKIRLPVGSDGETGEYVADLKLPEELPDVGDDWHIGKDEWDEQEAAVKISDVAENCLDKAKLKEAITKLQREAEIFGSTTRIEAYVSALIDVEKELGLEE